MMRDETIMYLIQQMCMFKRPKWRHTVDEESALDGYCSEMEGITREEVDRLIKYLKDEVFVTTGVAFFPDPSPMKLHWKEMLEKEKQAIKRVQLQKQLKEKEKEIEKKKLSDDKIAKAHDKAREYINSLTEDQQQIARQVLLEYYAEWIVDLPNPLDERPREVRLAGIRGQIKKRDLSEMLGAFITSGRGTEMKNKIESKFK